MWSIEAILLLVIGIFSLIGRAVQMYHLNFSVQYAQAQFKAQKMEAAKIEEEMQKARDEQAELEKLATSDKMAEIGKLGGLVKQEQALEGRFYGAIMEQPEVQLGLAALEKLNPELFDFVTQRPHLIPQAMDLLQKFKNKGNGQPMLTPVSTQSGKSGWS